MMAAQHIAYLGPKASFSHQVRVHVIYDFSAINFQQSALGNTSKIRL